MPGQPITLMPFVRLYAMNIGKIYRLIKSLDCAYFGHIAIYGFGPDSRHKIVPHHSYYTPASAVNIQYTWIHLLCAWMCQANANKIILHIQQIIVVITRKRTYQITVSFPLPVLFPSLLLLLCVLVWVQKRQQSSSFARDESSTNE